MYIVGTTTSTNFPTSAGAFDSVYNGGVDAFAIKVTDDGQTLTYGTYLGGAGDDTARDVYVASSRAYVTGYTRSADFPTTAGAFDTTHNGGTYDAFVTRVASGGNSLEYSTYLGGSGGDYAYGIVASASYASVVGETGSANFPTTTTGFDTSYGGGYDAFVARLSTTGASLDYGTYLGGSNADSASAVDIDSVGYLHLTGAAGDGFPVHRRRPATALRRRRRRCLRGGTSPRLPQHPELRQLPGRRHRQRGRKIDRLPGRQDLRGRHYFLHRFPRHRRRLGRHATTAARMVLSSGTIGTPRAGLTPPTSAAPATTSSTPSTWRAAAAT